MIDYYAYIVKKHKMSKIKRRQHYLMKFQKLTII